MQALQTGINESFSTHFIKQYKIHLNDTRKSAATAEWLTRWPDFKPTGDSVIRGTFHIIQKVKKNPHQCSFSLNNQDVCTRYLKRVKKSINCWAWALMIFLNQNPYYTEFRVILHPYASLPSLIAGLHFAAFQPYSLWIVTQMSAGSHHFKPLKHIQMSHTSNDCFVDRSISEEQMVL